MSDPSTQLTKSLRKAGYSITHSRQIVFHALQQSDPQTMHELLQKCSDIDRASVYRTILLFEKLNVVRRIQIGWKYKLELSDHFMNHHHHLSCIMCSRLISLPEDINLERNLINVAAKEGFVITDHQIEVQGVCSVCKIKQS